ncbi:uncharacterized protein GGS22DRAFT_169635 [Annulohypoxylon maeteangense]|uniref:uncharacterized protein n=1 Tax=Annulohypoxylon maeteangense TaxID=1927788 RepID=UPI0020079F73|nr:uncharacterized protein GGS22DRAFT_169635 [Annulohypoxylon maeteangense]KAI0882514.1 hypothetical protein GGS22DRAFT_169635 [Annulohypoxylon maeteangense]
MQKILRRVATAERAVAKRHKKQIEGRDKKEFTRQRLRKQQQLEAAKVQYRDAKKAVKDAWELGPMAPRHDVGVYAGSRGAIPETRFATFGKPTQIQLAERSSWAGGTTFFCLAVNDRVVLLAGPDKGRIGRVTRIESSVGEVYVEGLNRSNVSTDPDISLSDTVNVMSMELGMPISRVRLVYPLQNPETGITKDVIINRIEPRNIIHDRYTGKRIWDRVVPGINTVIPWPEKEQKDIKDRKNDTLRIEVEEKTFVPTLLRPPMPEMLIDELRGKYSRFRTRHDPEYIARLEAQEQAEKDRKKLVETMRTPLQELHRAEREKKKKKGKPRLTIEMLEKIGEVMARNMERQRNASALSEETGSIPAPTSTSAETEAKATEDVPQTPLETGSEETPPPPSS